ncbi:MAG: MerR family transcriptional regulator [Acidimicrobiales bacterium]|jgi:DNA-binding transcriptional MerR regulator
MSSSLAIGDFARATHMSVKTLRHYHQIGLLEPSDIDSKTGYRYYDVDQIPIAQVIRRFRDLDMPLNEIHHVLTAPDISTRNELIAVHLARLEGTLSQTQSAVTSLRELLEKPAPTSLVGHRSVEATPVVAISEVVHLREALAWHQGALGELYATLSDQRVLVEGASGGIYSNELFSDEKGQATIFVPCSSTVKPVGRVRNLVVPAVELATIVHTGPHKGIDRAYGSLATYVTQHELAVDGPIREYYLVGQHETTEEAEWRTEIGWPIFRTRNNSGEKLRHA